MITRYRRWRASRRKIRQCEKCGQMFRPKDTVLVTTLFNDEFGMGAITATYCTADAPEEALDGS